MAAAQRNQTRGPCLLANLPDELLHHICVFLDKSDIQALASTSPLFEHWQNARSLHRIGESKLEERYQFEIQMRHEASRLFEMHPNNDRTFYDEVMSLCILNYQLFLGRSGASTDRVSAGYTQAFYKHLIPFDSTLGESDYTGYVPELNIYSRPDMTEIESQLQSKLALYEELEGGLNPIARDIQRFLRCPCLHISEEYLSFDCIYEGLFQIWAMGWSGGNDYVIEKHDKRARQLKWISGLPKRFKKTSRLLLENLAKAFAQLGSVDEFINSEQERLHYTSEQEWSEYKRFLEFQYRHWFVGFLLRKVRWFYLEFQGFPRLTCWIRGEPCTCKSSCSCHETTVEMVSRQRWHRWRAHGRYYRGWVYRESRRLARPVTYEDFVTDGGLARPGRMEKQGNDILTALGSGGL